MIIMDTETNKKRMYVDECVYPGRHGCRGCEYALDPKLSDPGCLLTPVESCERILKARGLWPAPTEKSTAYLSDSETILSGKTKRRAR